MTPARYQFTTPHEERIAITVSKESLLILQMCDKERDSKLVQCITWPLERGLARLIRKEKIKDAELISKIIGLYDEAVERKKRGITN